MPSDHLSQAHPLTPLLSTFSPSGLSPLQGSATKWTVPWFLWLLDIYLLEVWAHTADAQLHTLPASHINFTRRPFHKIRGGTMQEGCRHHRFYSLWANILFFFGGERSSSGGEGKMDRWQGNMLQNWQHLKLPIQTLCCFNLVTVAQPWWTGGKWGKVSKKENKQWRRTCRPGAEAHTQSLHGLPPLHPQRGCSHSAAQMPRPWAPYHVSREVRLPDSPVLLMFWYSA